MINHFSTGTDDDCVSSLIHDTMSTLEKIKFREKSRDRIRYFMECYPDPEKKYPAYDFFVSHGFLVGSCFDARFRFCRSMGIDIKNGQYSVNDFIKISLKVAKLFTRAGNGIGLFHENVFSTMENEYKIKQNEQQG